MRRKIALIATALLVLVGITTGAAAPAQAAYPVCGTYGSIHAGSTTTLQSAIFGTQAIISPQDRPRLCAMKWEYPGPGGEEGTVNNSQGDSTIWTMIAAYSKYAGYTNREYHAQTGFGRFGGQSVEVLKGWNGGEAIFAEYVLRCYGNNTCAAGQDPYKFRNIPDNPDYAGDYYDAFRDPTSGNFLTMRWGNPAGVLLQSGYDPIGNWQSAWKIQWAGEVKHWEDDMYGTHMSTDYAAQPTKNRFTEAWNLKYYTSTSWQKYTGPMSTVNASNTFFSRIGSSTYRDGSGTGPSVEIGTNYLGTSLDHCRWSHRQDPNFPPIYYTAPASCF